MNDEIKKVYVRLKSMSWIRLWVVDVCPYCGGSHTHGAGSIDKDPRKFLGFRAAHCNNGLDYELVEKK